MTTLKSKNITIDDCWNRNGVLGDGDRSCDELNRIIHCRNCRKFILEGRKLLDREVPRDYTNNLHEQISAIPEQKEKNQSVVVFRLGDQWFGLPPKCFNEVTKWHDIHSIPHNRSEEIKGIVAVRGELQLCISLGHILGVNRGKSDKENIKEGIYKRMVVFVCENNKYIFPVSEIREIHYYSKSDLSDPPATAITNSSNVVQGVLHWKDKYLSCLDSDVLGGLIEGVFE